VVRITRAAANQVDDLISFYIFEKTRPEAARRLREDLANARRIIEAAPDGGADFPRPYPRLKSYGFRWYRVRVYWVSWRVVADVPVVTNVFHVSADIERRAAPTVENILDW
jgi:plasmid stabilization system protein ParE